MVATSGQVADDMFYALSDLSRRQLLIALLDQNQQNENGHHPRDLVSNDHEEAVLELKLSHTHLPKLDEMGFIDWNREQNKIQKGTEWDTIKPLLTILQDHQDELPDEVL